MRQQHKRTMNGFYEDRFSINGELDSILAVCFNF